MDLLAQTDPLAAARAHKAGGGRVVGFMSNNVPVELLHAAGCFPLQLPPSPGEPTPLADEYMEVLFDPLVRSVFQRILRGDFDFVDLIVLPRSNDSMQRFYYYLCELRRTGAHAVPEPFLYDLLHTPFYTSAEHNHARTLELKARLEALGGKPVTDDALRTSIALYNRIRARLEALAERRRATPPTLSGEVALQLYSAAQTVPPETLESALAELASNSETLSGRRVLLVGSAHDTPALHRMIAEAGGEVVGDFHWRGDLLFGPPVAETGDPLRAITQHYHRDSVSSRTFPSEVDSLVAFAGAAGAEAAVFFYYAEEEALVWDFPAQRQALEAAGVATLGLSLQPWPADDRVREPLRAFLAPKGVEGPTPW